MAQRTTNLDLVLPVQAEDVLVQDVNGNMTKIDTFAGQTNQALSTLSTKINATATSDCNTATETGRYLTSVSTQNQPSASHWIIDVIKYNANEISQVARGLYANAMFIRAYNNGTWTAWEQLALKNDLITRNITPATATTVAKAANGYIDIDASYSGYTPIGVLAINTSAGGTAQNWLILWSYQVTNNTVRLSYKNTNESNDATVLPTVTVLYRRN